MTGLARMFLLAGLAVGGGASAAMPNPAASIDPWSGQLLQEVQYRRGRPRCFTEARRVRFIDRFGRPRVRIVERRVCR